ncbi:acetyl-CoA carboxylase, carboxyltransferase subunit beta [Luteibaculum oceani]|uniref:Acetyl-coenzyme A carboxylase carboxyl transferase subunit beta n=1 Tax=Luteibaculum oceani TaxID=1294296 RepID=A0A5C6UYI3_9FLAO|nr:acetyl-CoA carboxylase, carboxyltransferase subunit beta [Luteibaculum oceani]TXC78543.1 acetyl-CoA carboxylase carboxyltransferase subunit beta [Luteibaculum oceani]
MGWFKRIKRGITTSTTEKKETPEGLWWKCKECSHVVSSEDHGKNKHVCESCGYHDRLDAIGYFDLLFDNGDFTEFNAEITSADPLNFEDTKKYTDRIQATIKKTGLKDAVRTAHGKIEQSDAVVAAMDFKFIGGSMGSVVGEKISLAIDKAIELNAPFIMISKSGGARMMEAGFSLMQMAKTSAKLTLLAKAQLPYISVLTNPTTGGVTASFAMLGDINIAEPKALIGFAGPRVVKETIGKDLPEGFQTSEFLLEHGFLDFIVSRDDLKEKLAQQIRFFQG